MKPLHYHYAILPINRLMHVYDFITTTGLYIHLSMKDEESFYILVYDLDNFSLSMRFFSNSVEATKFIQSLR